MRILFFCGALLEGHDGVGDYTRKLAAKITSYGYSVFIIAYNDSFTQEQFVSLQTENEVNVPVARLPSAFSEIRRRRLAKKYVVDFNPDFISLQFVPYSFNSKGIPFSLCNALRSFGTYRWHIMFHELWLDHTSGVKKGITALAQRILVKRLVERLKPCAVNVSIPFNQNRLRKLGIRSEILGLFGNISKGQTSHIPAVTENLPSTSVKILYFGAAPRGRFLEQIKKGIAELSQKTASQLCLIIACGNSIYKETFVKEIRNNLSSFQVSVVDTGFLASEQISSLMDACTVGIGRSEPHLVGKSGTIMSMLEHGLPVWMPKWEKKQDIVFDFRPEVLFADLYEAVKARRKFPYNSLLEDVSKSFLNQLSLPLYV